jgi:hypothetical protein
MSASGKNMEAIYKAKAVHDQECPWGGEGSRVCMHPFDVERMGWEDGDLIVGLVLVSDTKVTTGMLRVECDAESNDDDNEIVEVVSKKDSLVTV